MRWNMADLKTISENLKTQDNRCTADPIFVVQGRRRVYGFDTQYSEDIAWYDDDGCAASDEEAKGLEEAYDSTGDEPEGWIRTAYKDFWENIQPFFTEAGAKRYLEVNGHNLRRFEEVRIYVDSAWRNEEWQFVREMLMKGEPSACPSLESEIASLNRRNEHLRRRLQAFEAIARAYANRLPELTKACCSCDACKLHRQIAEMASDD